MNLAEIMTVIEQNAFCGIGVGEILGFQTNVNNESNEEEEDDDDDDDDDNVVIVDDGQQKEKEEKRLKQQQQQPVQQHHHQQECWLKWIVARFNATSLWVAHSILTEEGNHFYFYFYFFHLFFYLKDVSKRAQLILFFMKLCAVSLNIGNVSLSYAVFAGELSFIFFLKKIF
jgi:hypothetical protein